MLRIVKVENGIVQGLPAADPRITSFKGIPFLMEKILLEKICHSGSPTL